MADTTHERLVAVIRARLEACFPCPRDLACSPPKRRCPECLHPLDDEAGDVADAVLRAFPEMQGWQDIATAPKDGNVVLLYKLDEPRAGEYTVSGYWGEWSGPRDAGWIACAGGRLTMPTHWRPLPAPPDA